MGAFRKPPASKLTAAGAAMVAVGWLAAGCGREGERATVASPSEAVAAVASVPSAPPVDQQAIAAELRRAAWERALAFDFDEPAVLPWRSVELWATNYYLPRLPATRQGGYPLLDPDGAPLGPKLAYRDWCNAALQGSVLVEGAGAGLDGADGEGVFNYAGVGRVEQVDCFRLYRAFRAIGRSRFRRSATRFGEGIEGHRLVPHRTLAVDPEVVPFGTTLYVPEARGQRITLPGGRVALHDGYYFAADRGGAIEGDHVDVFAGETRNLAASFVGHASYVLFVAYLFEDPLEEAAEVLAAAHELPPPTTL